MEQTEPRYQIQESVIEILAERPDYLRYFEEMVAWEEADNVREKADWEMGLSGWTWAQVHTPTFAITNLITRGIVDEIYRSRSSQNCRLTSLSDTKEALDMVLRAVGGTGQPKTIPVATDHLFDLVIGQERAKSVLTWALESTKPVHVLLNGSPGTAKTMLLEEISKLPGGMMYDGGLMTKAGLVGMLLKEQPKYLCIDELSTMSPADMTPLLNLMETGRVTRLQHRHLDNVQMQTWVFAGSNHTKNLTEQMKNRYVVVDVPPYNKEDFKKVAFGVLTQQEGVGPQVAQVIVDMAADFTLEIRKVRDVARMAKASDRQFGRPQDVPRILAAMFPRGAVSPIRKVK